MRRRLFLGLIPLVPASLLIPACAAEPVDIGLVMLAPQGLLETATSVELSVFDASAAKRLKNGHVCKAIVPNAVCACDCTAQEILLSVDDAGDPGLKNAPPRSKSHLAMSFAPGATKYPIALRAVFTNVGPDAKGGADVSERFL